MKNSLLIILVLIGQMVSAQNFFRTYGLNYEAYPKTIRAIDGGFIIAGSSMLPGAPNGNASDILIIKTDTNGVMQWSERLQSALDDEAYWIEADDDSTYLVCGNSYDNNIGKLNIFVIRMGLTGNIISQKIYKNFDAERAASIQLTNDGGAIIAGETNLNTSDLQMYLLKIDSAGNVQWSHNYGTTDQEYGTFAMQTADGGYISTGVARVNSFVSAICVVKTDSAGALQWAKKYNTTPVQSKCLAFKIINGADNGYVVCGATDDVSAHISFFAMKIDTSGDIVWQNTYRNSNDGFCWDMVGETSGATICGGQTDMNANDHTVMFNIDDLGNLNWATGYEIADSSMTPSSLLKLSNTKYLISGVTNASSSGASRIYLVESDTSNNQSLCNQYTPVITQTVSSLAQLSFIQNNVDTTTALAANYTLFGSVQEEVRCLGGGVSVNDISKSMNAKIYADASGNIVYENGGNNSPASITMYSLDGKLLFSVHTNSSRQIILSEEEKAAKNIATGMYLVKLNVDGADYSMKISLQ
jgi:hypothetical protein